MGFQRLSTILKLSQISSSHSLHLLQITPSNEKLQHSDLLNICIYMHIFNKYILNIYIFVCVFSGHLY